MKLLRAAFLSAFLWNAPLVAQGAPPADTARVELIRVFLDCQSSGCDDDFFRTEITWVNFVRDRTAANVFVLVASQRTGSGGSQFSINFDGQGTFAGVRDSLGYTTRQGNTDDENRRALSRTLAFGLLRFARSTPVADRLQLTLSSSKSDAPPAGARGAADRWNLWVYSVSANTFANGDANYKSANVFGNLSARRVTEAWKLNLNTYINYSENSYKLSSGSIANYQHSYGASGEAVKSINDRWSTGITGNVNSSKYENYRLSVQAMPAIEFDLFPYKEATRRQLVVRYGVGVRSFQYDSTTIFGKLRETRPAHELIIAAEARQKWGSLNLGLGGNQFLDDLDKRRLSINGGVSWRIVRGLEFNVFGSYEVLRDQLNIPRGELDDADILIRLRQIRSGYNYFGSVGLSYTFGSLFNNVVNPRFGGGGGRGFTMRM
ncbi:MAG: hypothetical protein IPP90_09885 [Gemmatimonadaceae bacterium]|nr:hypothetical protein [Gemmatimonadaceae bacterium]